MITNNDQSLVLVFGMPFFQRWHDMLTIDATKRPHFNDDYLAAQVSEAQRRINI